MKIKARTIFCLLLCWFPASVGFSQAFGTGNHTVTVQILPVTDIRIIGGGVNLTVAAADVVAGQATMIATDQSSQLQWATNSSAQKITVSTNLATPRFALVLQAVNPSAGSASPEVALSMSPTNLIVGIGRSAGTCTLRYTGIADAAQGTGTDNHVITFTVQAE